MSGGKCARADNGSAHDLSVKDVFTTVADTAETTDDGKVSVGDIFDVFGARAYGPLLFVLGVVMLTPLGAIPGAPLFSTILVLLLMGQALLREGAPWVPDRIRSISFEGTRLRAGLSKALPYFEWLDWIIRPRLTALLKPPLVRFLFLCCIFIALTMIPLGFVPFGVVVPSLSLAIIGLGMTNSDGVLVICGVAIAGAAMWLGLEALIGLGT
jgi:hypothetical protein